MPYKVFVIHEVEGKEPEVKEYNDLGGFIFYGSQGDQVVGQANVRSYDEVRSLGGAFFDHMDKIRHTDPERLKDISFAERAALTVRNGWRKADPFQRLFLLLSAWWSVIFLLSTVVALMR